MAARSRAKNSINRSALIGCAAELINSIISFATKTADSRLKLFPEFLEITSRDVRPSALSSPQ